MRAENRILFPQTHDAGHGGARWMNSEGVSRIVTGT